MKKKTSPKKLEKSFGFGEVMTLLEQMNDGIGVIAEAQEFTNKKLSEVDTRLVNVENRLVNVEDRLINVETRLVNVEDRLINVENRLVNVEDRLISVEDDVIEVKHRLSEKVDRDEFNKMEKRMIKLEKLVFAKLSS